MEISGDPTMKKLKFTKSIKDSDLSYIGCAMNIIFTPIGRKWKLELLQDMYLEGRQWP